ncbi:MAG: PEPxxWA-CTERM sorting domain-containing protein [Candidatus Methylumidiphilus sp.]
MQLKQSNVAPCGADIAFSSVIYLPQAGASVTDLGPIGLEDSTGVASGSFAKGSFDDTFQATVTDPVSPSSTGNPITSSTAPVPEPEEWVMMIAGIGLIGYQIRRKQKNLSQSSLG